MPFGGRSPASGGEGVELARGYISLTAKYSPAMQQIASDFRALEAEADKAGVAAGAKLKSGIAGGAVPLGTHLRSEFAKAGRYMESDAQAYGTVIGAALGKGISAPFRAVDRVVGSLGTNIKNTVTGPMAKMIGGATVLGVAFETMSKGWELDVKIDKTRTQLEGLGATAKDIQEFMGDVQESLKGTSNSFSDVADAAKDLFAEGRRGNALTEELRTVQNMAAIAGKDVESLWGTFEKAHGRDAINPMVLGSLQMQGLPAREELAKALNLKGTADEINEELDKALKAKSGGPTWDTLFQQFAKDFPDAAEKYSKSLEGQLKKVQTNLGKVGGDFIKGALGGGTGGLEGINSQLEKLDGWVNSHQAEIHHFFEQLASVAKDVGKAVGDIKGVIDQIPGGIRTVIDVWVGWKVLSIVSDLTLVKTTVGLIGDAVGLVSFGAWSSGLAGVIGGLTLIKQFIDEINHLADEHPHNLSQMAANMGIPNVPTPGGPPVLSPQGVIPPSSPSPAPAAPGDIPGMMLPGFSHAKGAVIQPAKYPHGIVQWAEPSTGGEAYIPLGLSNRSRSVAIWKETGRRLRMFAGGGFMAGNATNDGDMPGVGPEWWRKGFDDLQYQPWWWGAGGSALKEAPWRQRGQGGGDNRPEPWDILPNGKGRKFAAGGINYSGDTDTMEQSGSGHAGLNDDWLPWILNPGIGAPGKGFQDPGQFGTLRAGVGATGWWGRIVDHLRKTKGGYATQTGPPMPWWMFPGDANAPPGPHITSNDEGSITGGLGPDLVAPPTPGGMAAVSSLLQTLGAFGGGSRTPYQLGGFSAQGIDCSGLVSAVINAYLGQSPFSGRMSTGGEQGWLAARGFKEGIGPPGSVQVGWSGAHTDMSIGGQAIESTTSHGISGVRVGKDAASPLSGQFPNHMWLPNTSGAMPVDISSMGGKALGSGGGKGTDGGGGFFSGLMGIAKDAAKDNLPPGFIDYSQNPWVKSGKAGLDMLIGKDGMGGLLDSMTGGAMGHPLRPLLAAQNPAKAAALGWTQPGGRNSDRLNSPLGQRGELAMAGGTAGRSGHGETFNYNIAAPNGVDTKGLNDMKKSHDASKSRQGTSVGGTSGAGRVGQPG